VGVSSGSTIRSGGFDQLFCGVGILTQQESAERLGVDTRTEIEPVDRGTLSTPDSGCFC